MFSPANEHQEGVETYAQRVGGGQSQLEGGTQLKGGRHSWRTRNIPCPVTSRATAYGISVGTSLLPPTASGTKLNMVLPFDETRHLFLHSRFGWKGLLKNNRMVIIKHHMTESSYAGNVKELMWPSGVSTSAAGAVEIMQVDDEIASTSTTDCIAPLLGSKSRLNEFNFINVVK
uniref:Uncharacterized protein n=1 Tax=Rhodnius prolixus TaxID=13249 RepID=T1HIY5_RHOPR